MKNKKFDSVDASAEQNNILNLKINNSSFYNQKINQNELI